MTNNHYYANQLPRARTALVLALSLLTFPAAFTRALNAQTPAKANPAAAGEPKGGPKEGIKVHGHWTIDVRNPNGKLVTHREFENAVFTNGTTVLALLGRQATPGRWGIFLGHGTGALASGFPDNALDGLSPWGAKEALILEPSSSLFADSKNLTLTIANQLVLTGSLAGTQDGSINFVYTVLGSCDNTFSPSTCSAGVLRVVTIKYPLDNPVDVKAGQIIQVSVVISFS